MLLCREEYLIVHWYGSLSHEQWHHSSICVSVLLRAQYQRGKVLQSGELSFLTSTLLLATSCPLKE